MPRDLSTMVDSISQDLNKYDINELNDLASVYGLKIDEETAAITKFDDKEFASQELNKLIANLVSAGQKKNEPLIIENAITAALNIKKELDKLSGRIIEKPEEARVEIALFNSDLPHSLESLKFLTLSGNVDPAVLQMTAEIVDAARQAIEKTRAEVNKALYLTANSHLVSGQRHLYSLCAIFGLCPASENEIGWKDINKGFWKMAFNEGEVGKIEEESIRLAQKLNAQPNGHKIFVFKTKKRIDYEKTQKKYYQAKLLVILDEFARGKSDEFELLNKVQELITETKPRSLRKQFTRFFNSFKKQVMDDQAKVLATIKNEEQKLDNYIGSSPHVAQDKCSFSQLEIAKILKKGQEGKEILVFSGEMRGAVQLEKLRQKALSAAHRGKTSAGEKVSRFKRAVRNSAAYDVRCSYFNSGVQKKLFSEEELVLVETLHQACRKAGYLMVKDLSNRSLPALDGVSSAPSQVEISIEMLCIALALKMLQDIGVDKIPSADRFERIFNSDPERKEIGDNNMKTDRSEREEVKRYYQWLLEVEKKGEFLQRLSTFKLQQSSQGKHYYLPGTFRVSNFSEDKGYSAKFQEKVKGLFEGGEFNSYYDRYYTGEEENLSQLSFYD